MNSNPDRSVNLFKQGFGVGLMILVALLIISRPQETAVIFGEVLLFLIGFSLVMSTQTPPNKEDKDARSL